MGGCGGWARGAGREHLRKAGRATRTSAIGPVWVVVLGVRFLGLELAMAVREDPLQSKPTSLEGVGTGKSSRVGCPRKRPRAGPLPSVGVPRCLGRGQAHPPCPKAAAVLSPALKAASLSLSLSHSLSLSLSLRVSVCVRSWLRWTLSALRPREAQEA